MWLYLCVHAQLCLSLCDPMGCSLPGLSVHGIFQARILERVVISFSRGSSQPRDQTQVSCTAGRFFTIWAPGIWVQLGPWNRASLLAQTVKNLPAIQETWVRAPGQEDPPEKGVAAHSSILAWRIPRTKEPGGLQSMGLQRMGHDWVNNTYLLINIVEWLHRNIVGVPHFLKVYLSHQTFMKTSNGNCFIMKKKIQKGLCFPPKKKSMLLRLVIF